MITVADRPQEAQVNEGPIPIPPGQPQWEKDGSGWVWKSQFCLMTVRVVNEHDERQFLIDIRHEYNKSVQAIALIPKDVMEDLYKELTQYNTKEQELIEVRAELARITADMNKAKAELEDAMARLNDTEVETDNDESYNG
jgi:septal ring factor EnvC (AmiA/AmiB activator)